MVALAEARFVHPTNHTAPLQVVPAQPDDGDILAQIGVVTGSMYDPIVDVPAAVMTPTPAAAAAPEEPDIISQLGMAVKEPIEASAAPPPPAVEEPAGVDGEFAGDYNPQLDPAFGLVAPTDQDVNQMFDPGTFRSRHAVDKAVRNMKTALTVPRSVAELTKMIEGSMLGSTADPYQDNLRSVIRAMVRGM